MVKGRLDGFGLHVQSLFFINGPNPIEQFIYILLQFQVVILFHFFFVGFVAVYYS